MELIRNHFKNELGRMEQKAHYKLKSARSRNIMFLGVGVKDDTVSFLANFLAAHAGREHMEFEGRLGIHLDGVERASTSLGISTTSCIDPSVKNLEFNSNIGLEAFVALNRALNQYCANFHNKQNLNQDYANYSSMNPLAYKHIVDLDLFFAEQIRVSIPWDAKRQGDPPKALKKYNLGNMDVLVPSAPFDLRFSCKKEEPVPIPLGNCEFIRRKDRLSYTFGYWSADLTKVETFHRDAVRGNRPAGNPSETTYELELEIIEPSLLKQHSKNSVFIHDLADKWFTSMKQLSYIVQRAPLSCKPPIPMSSSSESAESKKRKRQA